MRDVKAKRYKGGVKLKLNVWLLLILLSFASWRQARAAPDAGMEADAGVASDGYAPAPSAAASDQPRDLASHVAAGDTVLRIPITGTIDLGLAAFVRHALSEHPNAKLIVLDVNTLGGRVDAAIQIRDALLDSPTKTLAFVHPRAISAGALITLACDVIAIAPGGSIGAVTPMSSQGEMSEDVNEKMTSYMRTEMRTTAEAKGRRGDLAEAMVDRDVVIKGIVPAGKLLTLDTEGALKHHIADFRASTLTEVLQKVGAEQGHVENAVERWAESLARFLTDPTVSGLLMTLGMLGLMIELYSPGLGLPGLVGALCLGSFFFGHAIANLAGVEEFVLVVAGVLLMALEIFVIPGFGVAGILSLVCLFLALVLTLFDAPLGVSFDSGVLLNAIERVSLSLLAAMGLALLLLRFLPKTAAGRRLVLAHATRADEGFISANVESELMGQRGRALTPLRPAGKARFGNKTVDVVTAGDYIERDQAVTVVEVHAGRVVVALEDVPND